MDQETTAADIQLYDENIFEIAKAEMEALFQKVEEDPRLTFQEWYLRTLKGIDHERAVVKAMAKGMIHSLDAEECTLVYMHGLPFKQAVMEDIAAKPKKGKSMKYFHGRAGFRAVPQSLCVTDPEKAMEWAEANCPDAVRKELRISIVQAQFKLDGIIPPGFDMTEPRESFSPITDYRTLKMAQVMEAHFGITVEAEDHPDKEEADANNDAFRRGKMKDHYVQGPSDAVEPPLADDRPASDQDEPEYHKDEDGSVSYK